MSETSRGAASGSSHARPGSEPSPPNVSAADSGTGPAEQSGPGGPATWSPVYGPIPTGPQAHAQPLGETLPEGVRPAEPGAPGPPAPVWAPQPPKPPKQSVLDRLGLNRPGWWGGGSKSATASPTPLAAAAAASQDPTTGQPAPGASNPYGSPVVAGRGPGQPGTDRTGQVSPGGGPPTAVMPPVPGAAGVGVAAGSTAPTNPLSRITTPRRTRKARLRLARLDPWSVMKTAFLFSIAGGIMLVVAVYAVWSVLEASQLFTSFNDIVKSVLSTPGDTTPFRVEEYVNTQKVMGVTALLACVNVVIITALATLGSFLYNLAATMLGGLELTLAED